MSQENAEIVREVMRLFNRAAEGQRTPELLELFAPDVVINMTRPVFNPDTYEGYAGLRRLGKEVGEVWDGSKSSRRSSSTPVNVWW